MVTTKKISFANFNATFGTKNEPLLRWLDSYFIPALQADFERQLNQGKTKFFFKDVKTEKMSDGEIVISGMIIKDTILDVYTKYEEKEDILRETSEQYQSSPYSIFVILLRNHRMFLVKNQSGSPDLRSFASTISEVIKAYRKEYNDKIKDTIEDEDIRKKSFLPHCILSIKGIKSQEGLMEAFSNVDKVKNITFKLKKRNRDLGSLGDLADTLEGQILDKTGTASVQIKTSSVKSVEKAVEIISEANDIFEVEANVEYAPEEIDEDGKYVKRSGKIKDDEMSEATSILVEGSLRSAITQIYNKCKEKAFLFIRTPNEEEYKEYVSKKEE